MTSGSAAPDTPVPPAVLALSGGEAIRLVWVNELGGLTFELGSGGKRRFVKWAPVGSGLDLPAEADRLSWAMGFTPVPRLLATGSDGEGTWIVTSPVAGRMAIDERWKNEPATAVRAIGEGLRAMHEALPVESCPFSWAADERLADARRRAALGTISSANWHDDYPGLSVEAALERLAAIPPVDVLVVCHGDTCAPNTLLDDDGRFCAHVDLGELGIADRWADLAIATLSATWNYGPGWEVPLLDAYGVAPDSERTGYYRLLWHVGP